MAQNVVALDVSAGSVRIAVLQATLRRAVLRELKTVALDTSLPPVEMWARVRSVLPEAPDTVVVGLDARGNSTRMLHFPFIDVRKVDPAVQFELEGQLPYELSEVAMAWSICARTARSLEVVAAVVPKGPLRELLGHLSKVGLEPRAAVQPAVALGEFVGAGGGPVAVLALGASHSHLAIVAQGVRYVRTLRVGGDDVDRAVARSLNLSVEAARDLKEAEGLCGPSAAHTEAVAAGLAGLVAGLVATFKALPQTLMPDRIVLTGGMSRLLGLPQLLQRQTGIAADLLDLRAGLPALVEAPPVLPPEYAIAVGLALAQYHQGRDILLNFRRGDLAYQGDIQLYRGQVTRLAVGLAACFTLALTTAVVRYSLLQAESRQLDQAVCETTQAIMGREICQAAHALEALRQAPQGDGAPIPTFSAGAVLEMLSRAVDPQIDVKFDEMDIRVDAVPGQPDRLSGKGEAASFEATEQLKGLIERDACVQDAEVSRLRKTQTAGRVEFNLVVKVACPPGVQPGAQLAAVAAPAPGPAAGPAAAAPLPALPSAGGGGPR